MSNSKPEIATEIELAKVSTKVELLADSFNQFKDNISNKLDYIASSLPVHAQRLEQLENESKKDEKRTDWKVMVALGIGGPLLTGIVEFFLNHAGK